MGHVSRVFLVVGLALLGCGPNWQAEQPQDLVGGADAGAAGGGMGGAGGGAAIAISFANDVMPIFKAKCGGCHGGSYEKAAIAYSRLKLNTTATSPCANTPRIIANDGANSLLVKKLLNTAGCGAVMPLIKVGMASVACVDEQCVAKADIQTVKLWIDQGALEN